MNSAYYLFSDVNHFEAIYVCTNNNYIDKPNLKTDAYPMGTLLSNAIRILKPWYEDNFNLFSQKEKLTQSFKNSYIKESSFPSIANKDIVLRSIFGALIEGQHYIQSDKNYDKFIKLLGSYMDYIALCQEKRNHLSIVAFNSIANKYDYVIPQQRIFASVKSNKTDILSKKEIEYLFNEDYHVKTFDPELYKQQKKLFELPEEKYEPIANEKLLTPIYVFNIYDIVDFIVASLQCILKQNYIIGKCKFCNELYITHNRKNCTAQSEQKTKKVARNKRSLNSNFQGKGQAKVLRDLKALALCLETS